MTVSGIRSQACRTKISVLHRPVPAPNNSVSSTPTKPSAKQVKVYNDDAETVLKKIHDHMAQMAVNWINWNRSKYI